MEQNKNKVMMHTNICVTFDMPFATPQSNSSTLLFLKNSSSVTTVRNKIGWFRTKLKEELARTAWVQMLRAATRKAARILISNLRHRHGLSLTLPAFSSQGG